MSQNETLWAVLCRGDSITTLEATINHGICRLSERIRELEKQKALEIGRERVKRNGKTYTRYFLRQLELAA